MKMKRSSMEDLLLFKCFMSFPVVHDRVAITFLQVTVASAVPITNHVAFFCREPNCLASLYLTYMLKMTVRVASFFPASEGYRSFQNKIMSRRLKCIYSALRSLQPRKKCSGTRSSVYEALTS